MKTNLYLGHFLYFATGEGYHEYLGVFMCNSNEDQHIKFFEYCNNRDPDFVFDDYKWWNIGVDIYKLGHWGEDNKYYYNEALDVIPPTHIKYGPSIIDLAKRDGLIGGDIFIKYCYNLS